MLFAKNKTSSPAEQQLLQISNILFPPHDRKESGGDLIQIDYSADMNLEAALTDLEDNFNDEITRKTIRDVTNRIYEIRRLLNVQQEINPNTSAIVISNKSSSIDEIVALDHD